MNRMKNPIPELRAKATKAFFENGCICVRLENEREIGFPVSKNGRSRNGTLEQLGNIELLCSGAGLHCRADQSFKMGCMLGWQLHCHPRNAANPRGGSATATPTLRTTDRPWLALARP
jgi:hypothetical protein